MTLSALDHLFLDLDVSVAALAMCEIGGGRIVVAPSGEAIIVHYVLAGTLRLSIEGFEPVVCGQGAIVIVAPGALQAIATTESGGITIMAQDHATTTAEGLIMLDAADGLPGELRFACGAVSADGFGSMGLFETGSAPLVENLGHLDFVRHAFDLMLQEMAAQKPGARALTGALMKACLLLMLRQRADRLRPRDSAAMAPESRRLGMVIKAVLADPGYPHTLASLASVAGMSRSSFARAFVAAFDITPMNFVLRTRLHQGAELLRTHTAPIKVVASTTGFASRSHFSRTFRTAYGLDPSAYRKQAAG